MERERVAKELVKIAKGLVSTTRVSATQKQVKYIVHLMIDAGHAHRKGYLRGSSKNVPHGPSMRERQGTVDEWAETLTSRQASEVIDYLLTS